MQKSIHPQNRGIAHILLILVGLAILVAGGIILILKLSSQSSTEKTTFQPSGFPSPTPTPAEEEKNIYKHEDFSVFVPEDWSTESQIPGTLLTIIKVNDFHENDPNAQKINFKSYIAITFDNAQGKTMEEITSNFIEQLKQTAPNTNVESSENTTINEVPTKIIEGSLNMQDVDFKVMVAIYISVEKYYLITANTTAKKWLEYKSIFEEVIQSFKIKNV